MKTLVETQIQGTDNLYKGDCIKKENSFYQIVDIDNEYVQSKFILEDVNTHEKKGFYFIDLIGAYKVELGR